MSREIQIQIGLYNEYKLSVAKADSEGNEIPNTRKDVTGWFHNLITNTGLENYGIFTGINWGRGCRVGSGSATPAFTDTNLQTIVATTVDRLTGATHSRNLAATPPYVEKVVTYRFAAGAAAGVLAEVGIVGSTSDGSGLGGALNAATPCGTRALILDGGGSPTTVTILSDEILDVTVRQRLYIPGDVVGTITPTGGVAGAINYVIRPCEVDQDPTTNDGGWGGNVTDYGWDFAGKESGGYGENGPYVGATSAIGITTGEPSGTKIAGGIGQFSTLAYVANSNYRDVKQTYPLGTALTGINNASGIGAYMICYRSCSFQIGFTPRMVKTQEMLFDLTFRLAWARYTP